MIDTRPLVAGLLSLVCAEPCVAQLQVTTPLPNSGSWLPSALQQYNPASSIQQLLPTFRHKEAESKAPQQRYFPYRPGNTPSKNTQAKRPLKVGPCALPFMENCVVGPYAAVSLAMGSNTLSGASSSSNSYPRTFNRNEIDTNSSHNISTNTPSLTGIDLSLGYDFGGIRSEINYSFSSGSTSNVNITGTDTYTSPRLPGVSVPVNAAGNISNMSLTRQALLWNTAIDIPTGTRLIPYFGGGVGAAWITLGSLSQQTSDLCTAAGAFTPCPATLNSSGGTASTMAAQAKAGISYLINLRTIMFLEAVYDYTGSVTIGNLNLSSFSQYSGKLGVRYRF